MIRRAWPLALLLLVYLGGFELFGALTAQRGLLTPEGSPDLGLLGLGLGVLGLRLALFFVVPPIVTYRWVRRLLTKA